MLEIQPLNPAQVNQGPSFWQIVRWIFIIGIPLVAACLFCLFAFKILVNNSKVSRRSDLEIMSPVFRELVAGELVDVSLIDLFFAIMGNSLAHGSKYVILTPSYDRSALTVRVTGSSTASYYNFVNSLRTFTHALGLVFLNIDGTIQPVVVLWLPHDTIVEVKELYKTKFNPLILYKAPVSIYALETKNVGELQESYILKHLLHQVFSRNLLPGSWIYNQQISLDIASKDYPNGEDDDRNNYLTFYNERDQNITKEEYEDFSSALLSPMEKIFEYISVSLKKEKVKMVIADPTDDEGFTSGLLTVENKPVSNYKRLVNSLSQRNKTAVVGYNFEYEDKTQSFIILWKPSEIAKDTYHKRDAYLLIRMLAENGFPILIASEQYEVNKFILLQIAIKDFSNERETDKPYQIYNNLIMEDLRLYWHLE